ncbi:MAG: hypothetical protein KFF46_10190 [Desulfobacterales bacterium]|nr:hypothetical protein [Desulfobacterales bacterium]
MKHIHIGFSIHRPEIIAKTAELMERHEAIFLEEPPETNFEKMLTGAISVDDYLMPLDLEYPAFSRQMCDLEKQLHASGKQLIQVEPFYEALLSIHDFFARGNTPDDLNRNSLPYYVFLSERQATGTLLNFYKTAAAGSFDAVVDAVRQFARADAARFRLRASLRAQGIARQAAAYSSIYVEAGIIHFFLWRELHKLLSHSHRVKPVFLDRLVTKDAGPRQHLYSPGDQLTLFYIFHPRKTDIGQETRLAARSIIYSKIIHKEENTDNGKAFFHMTDEKACIRMVKKLSINDCRRLYGVIKQVKTIEARRIVENFLEKPAFQEEKAGYSRTEDRLLKS